MKTRPIGGVTLFDIFNNVTGLSVQIADQDKRARANRALSRDGLRILGKVNQLATGKQSMAAHQRARLIRWLEDGHGGHPILLTRSQVRTFLDRCAEQNEKLRLRWFPDRDVLFPEEFADIPEQLPPSLLSSEEIDQAARTYLEWALSGQTQPPAACLPLTGP